MEPFATKPARQLKLHWWIVSGVAAAFLVWQLDLIPRVRSAATGSVAKTIQVSHDETYSFLDADWGDIRDESSAETDSEVIDSTDPLVHALAHSERRDAQGAAESDSRDANRTSQKGSNVRRSTQVTQASYEPDAPQSSEENPVRARQPVVLTADIAARLRRIEEIMEEDQILEAHQEMSDIYWKHP
jgi:hypothetical protein